MLKLKLQYFGHLVQRADSLEKTLMLGTIKGRRRGPIKDEMAGWDHWHNGHDSEQTPRDTEGQGSLVNCSLQGHKELDRTKKLNKNKFLLGVYLSLIILSFLCLLSLLTANSFHLGYIDKIIVILTFLNQPKSLHLSYLLITHSFINSKYISSEIMSFLEKYHWLSTTS